MTMRTTVDAVRLICNTALADDAIEAYIADASAWVDAYLDPATARDGGCGDATVVTLTAVEKYLTAYFMTRREPQVKTSKVGPLSDTFAVSDDGSEFLVLASSFDSCGIVLETLGAGAVAPQIRFRVGAGFDERHTVQSSDT